MLSEQEQEFLTHIKEYILNGINNYCVENEVSDPCRDHAAHLGNPYADNYLLCPKRTFVRKEHRLSRPFSAQTVDTSKEFLKQELVDALHFHLANSTDNSSVCHANLRLFYSIPHNILTAELGACFWVAIDMA